MVNKRRGSPQGFTYENEADGDDVSQEVAFDGLAVLPVTFSKEADEGVELVLTQTLAETREMNSSAKNQTRNLKENKSLSSVRVI